MKSQTTAEILAPYRAMLRKRKRRRNPRPPDPPADPWRERRIEYLTELGRNEGEVAELLALRAAERMTNGR